MEWNWRSKKVAEKLQKRSEALKAMRVERRTVKMLASSYFSAVVYAAPQHLSYAHLKHWLAERLRDI